MEKTSVMIMMILCVCELSQADWNEVATLPQEFNNVGFNKMYFIDTSQGWLLGKSASISSDALYLLRSSNGGNSWTAQNVDSKLAYMWDICFIDNNIGWMVGDSKQSYGDSLGLIYKTVDGGLSWQLVLEGKHIFRPRKITFPTSTVGYFFCTPITWGELLTGNGYGTVGKTKDGGNTWDIDTLDGFERKYFVDAYFINADTGWAVGGDRLEPRVGFIMQTLNGGETWNIKSIIDINVSELMTVYFVDDKKGWIGGYHRIESNYDNREFLAYTEDGGNTWVVPSVFQDNWSGEIHKIHFFNKSVGWAVGVDRLYFTRNNGIDWEIIKFNNGYDGINNAHFFNLNYILLNIRTSNEKWKIYKTNNNGGFVSVELNLHQKSQSLQPFNRVCLKKCVNLRQGVKSQS